MANIIQNFWTIIWDRLIAATEKDRVDWHVVECERHGEDLSAVLPSYNFLRAKGLR